MKIQPTNLNKYSDNSRSREITYGHKSAYSYLKNIQGNRCACCGREMIPSKDIATVWGKITRPLTVLLKEGRFDFAQTVYPAIYNILEHFAKKFPDESLDSIVSETNNHFEYMTAIEDSFKADNEFKRMSGLMQQKEIKNRTMEMFRISSTVLKDSAEVIQNLKSLEHYLYGYRKDIFDELKILSEKYPDKKLNEIIKYPNVAEKYVANTYKEAMEFAKIRDEHWNKANKIILDKYPELEEEVNKLYTDICLTYRRLIDPVKIAYDIKSKYENFLDSYNLNEIKKPVLAEITQMPTKLFSKNSFLSFARRYYNDGEIINYVIKPFMESLEHIYAISAGGTNAVSNIIMMCRQCNNGRKNYSYSEYLNIYPEMIVNTEKQIKFYADKILSGEIPFILKRYPIEVAKTLYRSSGGLMNYNIDYYTEALKSMDNH